MIPIYSYRYDHQRAKSRQDVLIIFVATHNFDEESISVAIEEQIENNLVPDELIILVRDPIFDDAVARFASSSTLESLKGRLGANSNVFLVSYNRQGQQARTFDITGEERFPVTRLKDFTRKALTSIFRRNGGFVESNSLYHFENPSGRHTERFIRLSNILVRGAEISFIAFCALEFIPDEATIAYIDTPALYAVVAAINDQIRSFQPERQPIIADNFQSYKGVEQYPFTRLSDATVIISASSSGGLAKTLVEKWGFQPNQIFHILYLGTQSKDTRVVCDLMVDKQKNPDGCTLDTNPQSAADCTLCKAGSKPIPLLGDQFDIAGPQLEPLLINKTDAPAGLAELFSRLAGHQVFGIGLSRTRQPRQYFIDDSALLRTEQFMSRFDYLLNRTVPAQTRHVVYLNNNSLPFANLAAQRITPDSSVQIIHADKLDSIDSSTQTPVIIIGGVIESGRSLQDISRDMRRVCPNAPLIYLVGFAKTTGENRRESLNNTLTQSDKPARHVFSLSERILLPPPESDSAWHRELGLLREPSFNEIVPPALSSFITQRRSRLEQTSAALVDEIFVSTVPGKPMSLQPGFVFWTENYKTNHSQADVFFTIASVLQQLRANSRNPDRVQKLESNWFQQTLLAPGNFGRFNDGVVQASLLRAAHPREMNYMASPIASQEMARIIRRIVESANSDRGEAAAEFGLALVTRRLQLCPADLKSIIDVQASSTPLVATLLKACERVLP
ncbi:MAG: hypothetical protein IPM93_09310 [Candidatus Obscuribacter sp.]|nr:hypothetical protein [Candidatus Obscuribacter sp.]